jgi:hypothetical protein
MALKCNFSKNPIGVPFPECYAVITELTANKLMGNARMLIEFWPTKAVRDNDVREKRIGLHRKQDVFKTLIVETESQLTNLNAAYGQPDSDKDAIGKEIERLEAYRVAVSEQLNTLVKDDETLTGDTPFFQTLYDIPMDFDTIAENPFAAAYKLLKTKEIIGVVDGKEVYVNFQDAQDA